MNAERSSKRRYREREKRKCAVKCARSKSWLSLLQIETPHWNGMECVNCLFFKLKVRNSTDVNAYVDTFDSSVCVVIGKFFENVCLEIIFIAYVRSRTYTTPCMCDTIIVPRKCFDKENTKQRSPPIQNSGKEKNVCAQASTRNHNENPSYLDVQNKIKQNNSATATHKQLKASTTQKQNHNQKRKR